jgi:hypothetical protein
MMAVGWWMVVVLSAGDLGNVHDLTAVIGQTYIYQIILEEWRLVAIDELMDCLAPCCT